MRIAILIENTKDSGGNRVIFEQINTLKKNKKNKINVIVVARQIKTIIDVFGQLRDFYQCFFKFLSFNCYVKLKKNFINFDLYDKVISTSRRTLILIKKPADKKHFHLLQHIEAWNTLNSNSILFFSKKVRYPNPNDLIKLVVENNIHEEISYLNTLSKINNFITVSDFLRDCIKLINSSKNNINVITPRPHILSHNPQKKNKEYDLMMFIRGSNFKGDQIVLELALKLFDKYKILIIINKYVNTSLINQVVKISKIKILNNPGDKVLADAYMNSKLVVHPSLAEGFGSIPQEALKCGCKVVASNVGWIFSTNKRSNKLLFAIKKHTFRAYLNAVHAALKN